MRIEGLLLENFLFIKVFTRRKTNTLKELSIKDPILYRCFLERYKTEYFNKYTEPEICWREMGYKLPEYSEIFNVSLARIINPTEPIKYRIQNISSVDYTEPEILIHLNSIINKWKEVSEDNFIVGFGLYSFIFPYLRKKFFYNRLKPEDTILNTITDNFHKDLSKILNIEDYNFLSLLEIARQYNISDLENYFQYLNLETESFTVTKEKILTPLAEITNLELNMAINIFNDII